MEQFIRQLKESVCLTPEQVRHAVSCLLDETLPVEAKAAFLTALAQKGESVEEIAAFAAALRERAVQPPLDTELRAGVILDVCGTGGDRLNTFNISTTVAIMVAAAGIPVAKHGNRAITSQAGSADVLEELGVRIDLSPEEAAQSLREHHFCFLFAPYYHPAFKHIAPARKLCASRGQRTIFNFLGPLLNPARPSAQLIGVPRPELCEPIAKVLQLLGIARGLVVSGSVEQSTSAASGAKDREVPHLDEFSTLGPNTIAEFYHARGFNSSVLSVAPFPLQKAMLDDLRGGDCAQNAEIVMRILLGKETGPKRDAVILNAAAALLVAGKVAALSEGWDVAGELIDTGAAHKKLRDLVSSSEAS